LTSSRIAFTGHRRRHLTLFEIVDQRHHPAIGEKSADADADDHERFENADRGHDAENQIRRMQICRHASS